MASDSLALPRIRSRRRRPWGPRTKIALLSCVVDACLLSCDLLWYPLSTQPFTRFMNFGLAIAMGLMFRVHVRQFRQHRDRDERGE